MQRETPMLGPLFNKVAGLKACSFLKTETPTQVFYGEYWDLFKNTYFEERLRIVASASCWLS